MAQQPQKPWIKTPCLRSIALSLAAGCNIYLKYENLQPSGSFKSRGIGNLMLQAIKQHGVEKPIHFYCSSGGNAGLACADAALSLGRSATIVVPVFTSDLMVGKLKLLSAEVHKVGNSWDEADTWLREELLDKDKNGVYVPPFDHEDVWHGASTMVDELVEQVGAFDAVVCSVGGGGLFNGLMEGVSRIQSSIKPIVVAMETDGADSLYQSVQKGEHIRLPGITSIAKSLGATKVSEQTFKLAMDKKQVVSVTLSDADAVKACLRFASEERVLVEPACGVSIALAYQGKLRETIGSAEGAKATTDEEWKKKKVVIIVCGGSNVTLDMFDEYKKTYA